MVSRSVVVALYYLQIKIVLEWLKNSPKDVAFYNNNAASIFCRNFWKFYPTIGSFVTPDEYRAGLIAKVDEWLDNLLVNRLQVEEEFTTTEDGNNATTTTAIPQPSASTVEPIDDVIYAADIEKAIQYSFTQEIPLNENLDSQKLYAVHLWINVLIRYLPIRTEVWQFLHGIRNWMFQLGPVSVSGDEFSQVVDKLEAKYQPFEKTPVEWQGCKGSKPHLRGYPCSLWQTFHTMSVTASLNDTQNMYNGLSSAIVGYVSQIFSCRHCAQNFLHKVESINQGNLPTSSFHTMLWLWQIHNMANALLSGDVTEDPLRPKQLWPSRRNCPQCRPLTPWEVPAYKQHQLKSFQNQFWNMEETAKYIQTVYSSVVPNGASAVARPFGDLEEAIVEPPIAGEDEGIGS